MSDFDELMRVYGLDERMFALGRLSKKERDKSRTALTDAISAVTSERDELKVYCDKLAAGLPEGMLPKDIENLRLANTGFAQENFELKAKLAEANEENKRLLEAINNIANLGLQKLPVDKRWGTALAFAVEALHRARLAKDES
jgi:hypothetical protein